MIKLKKPETVRKTLSVIALSAGLFSTTVFANTSANYSFGFEASGDGGPKFCWKTQFEDCGTSSSSTTVGFSIFGNIFRGRRGSNDSSNDSGNFSFGTISEKNVTTQSINCLPAKYGSPTCTVYICGSPADTKTGQFCR